MSALEIKAVHIFICSTLSICAPTPKNRHGPVSHHWRSSVATRRTTLALTPLPDNQHHPGFNKQKSLGKYVEQETRMGLELQFLRDSRHHLALSNQLHWLIAKSTSSIRTHPKKKSRTDPSKTACHHRMLETSGSGANRHEPRAQTLAIII